jgi:hypothetical protein
LLVAGLVGLRPAPAASQAPAPPEPVVLRADGAGVALDWRAPAFSVRRVTGDDGRPYSAVEAPGWPQTDEPGQPQLPFASALAVVPPTGDVMLHVEILERARRPLPHPVVPARTPVPVGDPPARVEWAWTRDAQAYAGAGPRPADAVTLEEAGWARGRRLVRLTFHPLRFDPAGDALDVTRRVRVELRFGSRPGDGAQDGAGESGWARDDPFTPVLQNAVVNPAYVTRFARPERTASAAASAAPGTDPSAPASPGAAPDGNPRYKLIVSREGVYQLTHDAMAAAGVPVTTTPPTAYRLDHAGEELACAWEGDGDGAFEPGERILFYARPTPTRFADYDVYWLTVGVTGTPMPVRVGDPAGQPAATAWATTAAEHDGGGQRYLSRYPSGRDGDRWYWDRIYWDYTTGTGEPDKQFNITLAAPDSGASPATLHVYLQATTSDSSVDPDHRVEVWLNGSHLGSTEWDGDTYHTATFHPQASLLQAGSNTVRLRLVGTGASSGVEEAWLDALELRYGVASVAGGPIRVEGEAGRNAYALGGFASDDVRIYDVTSLTATQMVTGFPSPSSGRVTFGDADAGTATYYLLAGDQIAAPDEIVPALTLADPPGGADYLIIAHSKFITAVAPLTAHRATNDGLRVFTTDVQAIYDVYSKGVISSTAIRQYIADAYENWESPRLRYVLLVGDGTEDPPGHAQSVTPRPNYIPPYIITDRYGEPAPSDNRFVTVDGHDNVADVFIGRLPVNTVAEATTIVEKILAYELNPPQWPWNERVLFFADAARRPWEKFHQDSDEVYASLPITYTGQRVYFCTSNCNKPHLYDDISAAHDATIHELDAGGLIASYVGHSSVHQWVAERMFHLDDVANLRNDGALPVFLELTCYTSDFSDPQVDSTLDESLLRQAGGGAVATWGPTAEGSTDGHAYLHRGFFEAVFQNHTTELGPAIKAAKLKLPGDHSDLHDTFILFGDPAMDLNLDTVPWAHEVFLPTTLRGH